MDTLDERILLIWLAATLVVASTLGLVVGIVDQLFVGTGVWVGPTAFVAATLTGSVYVSVRYRTFRFECGPDVLYIERGVFTRVQTVVQVASVLRIDVCRGPIEGVVGLQRLVVHSAGTPSATVAIPGLSADRAQTLQDRLQANPTWREIAAEPDRLSDQYGSSRTSDPESS